MNRILLALLVVGFATAQSFEVASIKLHPGEVTISVDPMVRGSRVIGTASTLLDMITSAYGIRYDQVSGAPSWAGSDHYDVDAKAPGDTPPTAAQAKLMMQALLAERFQLKLHRETRQVPVYALVPDKDGPRLKAGAVGAAPGGSMRTTAVGLHMETQNSGLDWLVSRLAGSAGRPVVDRTGLTGSYEYAVDWFPANRVPPAGSNAPSMFDAVREQLGLRLESSTGPQEFLVIDSAARASEN